MAAAAIAAAKRSHLIKILQQKYQVFDMGRFARSPGRKVTYQHHRKIKFYRFKYLLIVQVITKGGYEAVNKRKRRKKYF